MLAPTVMCDDGYMHVEGVGEASDVSRPIGPFLVLKENPSETLGARSVLESILWR